MRIFWWEMRKIWRLPLIVAIIAAAFMFFYIFLIDVDWLHYSGTGLNSYAINRISNELFAEYSETLEPEERLDAEKYIDKYCADMDEFILDNPLYKDAGIHDGAELWAYISAERETPDTTGWSEEEIAAYWEEYNRVEEPFSFGEYLIPSDYAIWKLWELSRFLNNYDCFFENEFDYVYIRASSLFEKARENMRNASDLGLHENLFPGDFFEAANYLFLEVYNIILVTAGILLLPFITRDRFNNMPDMQYSGKRGRGIIPLQFAAALISVFVLTVIELFAFITLFLHCNADYAAFFNQPVFTLMWFGYLPLVNLTFTQFIAVFSGLILLMATGAAALFFFLSVNSRDYISLLLKALPLMTALSFIGVGVLQYPLCYNGFLYGAVKLKGIEFIVCGIVLITGMVLCAVKIKRLKRKDL